MEYIGIDLKLILFLVVILTPFIVIFAFTLDNTYMWQV